MPTYCVARIVIRYGKIVEFFDAMSRLVPIMEDKGWKLHAAYHTTMGMSTKRWTSGLPDANAVGEGLQLVEDQGFHELTPDWLRRSKARRSASGRRPSFSP